MTTGHIWEISVLSSQLRCIPQTALKICFKKSVVEGEGGMFERIALKYVYYHM